MSVTILPAFPTPRQGWGGVGGQTPPGYLSPTASCSSQQDTPDGMRGAYTNKDAFPLMGWWESRCSWTHLRLFRRSQVFHPADSLFSFVIVIPERPPKIHKSAPRRFGIRPRIFTIQFPVTALKELSSGGATAFFAKAAYEPST